MKRSLIALQVFITFNSFAQDNSADSLKLLLRSEIQDTTRVLILGELARNYFYSSPEIAMGYYHQCLMDPEISNNNELVCETTLGMAKLFKNARQADSALHYSRLSLAAAYGGGFTNTASGTRAAIVGGSTNTANGNYSFVGAGYGNTAASYGESVFGLYASNYTPSRTDYPISTDRLFVVGNGTADASRSNAFTILKNANTTLGGSLTINGNGTSYSFPTDRGANGQLLKTNADGTTSWASAGSFETDPMWTSASTNYYTKTNMQTSDGAQLHFNNLTYKPTTLAGYGITDAMSTAHAANAITSTNITNWNTAFGWGNHAGLYRPISYVPAWSEITSNPFSIPTPSDHQLLKYNSTSSRWENWTPNYLTSVTGTGPIISSGGTTPAISITAATTSAAGSMSASDKTKLDGIAAGAEVNVNADWSALTGVAQILHKPDLSVYATKNMNNQNITSLANPVNVQDAATKAYVDKLESKVSALENMLIAAGL